MRTGDDKQRKGTVRKGMEGKERKKGNRWETKEVEVKKLTVKFCVSYTIWSGASIPMDRGDTSPQYLDWRKHDPECPPNISRVISATFYPRNIFLIS